MAFGIYFDKYKKAMLSLPADTRLTKEDLLVERFRLDQQGKLEVYYAPHNEYINRAAKVVILGLTPGWKQMQTAYEEARAGLELGLSDSEICRRAKMAASFAGSMRLHLVEMLDQLGLPLLLGIETTGELFGNRRDLLHTTSVLRYPVFLDKCNYSGSTPDLLTHAYLREWAYRSAREELELFGPVLVIPLGRKVEAILAGLVDKKVLNASQCLWGFPHPSGANGHRHAQFAEGRSHMREILRLYGEACR